MNRQPWLLRNSLLAAIYAALTLGLAPFSYGPIQVRLSECLTLLAFCSRRWIPGLTIGCFLANVGSPFGLPDMVLGTLATFLGIWPMHRLKSPLLASLCPVLSNGVVIGAELDFLGPSCLRTCPWAPPWPTSAPANSSASPYWEIYC